jgi:hydrogenase maturation protease
MTVKTLVVGVGNPTRRDDGVGWVVAERIDALGLRGVEVRTTQQLQVELAGDFARYERVVVIDASLSGAPVGFGAVVPEGAAAASHHLSPATLLALTLRLCGRLPDMVVCTVRGEAFGFGETLSPRVTERVNEAVAQAVGAMPGSGTMLKPTGSSRCHKRKTSV